MTIRKNPKNVSTVVGDDDGDDDDDVLGEVELFSLLGVISLNVL